MTIQKEPLISTAPPLLQVSGDAIRPIAVSVAKACELSGFGPTSIWAFLKSGRLEAVRVPGVRRTLVKYESLARLLSPPSEAPPRHKRSLSREDLSDVRRRLDELTSKSLNRAQP